MTKARTIANLGTGFVNITDTGTEGTKVASGTTAQRGSTQGQFRFNSTTGLAEYYDGTSFKSIDSPPVLSSIDVTEIDSAAGGNQTIVLSGSNFSASPTVKFLGNSGVDITPSTVTRNSSSQITTVTPKSSFLNAQEPYDVRVTNLSGLTSTLADQINVDSNPVWSTASGSLGIIWDSIRGNSITVSATDSDGDTIAYSVLSGSLPAGATLNSSTGVISGFSAVGSDTVSNFTIRATANSKTADRAFSLEVKAPVTSAYSYTGSEQSFSVPSGLSSLIAYVWGAGGASGFDGSSGGKGGGSGGFSQGTINLSGISTLKLVVGMGGNHEGSSSWGKRSGSGGGTTGIFNGSVTHGNSVIVSGSGGGGGSNDNAKGGAGGGANLNGGDGGNDARGSSGPVFGYGGTTSAGGAAANWSGAHAYQNTAAQSGGTLSGGDSAEGSGGFGMGAPYLNGGRGSRSNDGSYQGGGGGGGYYGGGGAQNGYNGGGGGGSGYANTSIVSSITGTSGSQGSGSSGVTTNPPETGNTHYASGIGIGGGAGAGGNGRIVLTY